jgi:rhamnose utilization protein RhaD (predicted bifunctional aldolase and dehydrogenase)
MFMSIEALVEISRYYGSNSDYIIAGGGNTSWKDSETLCVKASGEALAEAVPSSFVRMERKALSRIMEQVYPVDSAERERAVLADLLAARVAGERKRPSVETLLHELLPFNYVVHTHPALLNGLTCSNLGMAAMEELFPEAVWIPSTNPGYVLALAVKKALDEYESAHGKAAAIIFLQNHGVFAGAQEKDGIKKIYEELTEKTGRKIKRHPDFSFDASDECRSNTEVSGIIEKLAMLTGGAAIFFRNREIAALLEDRASFYPVSSAFTPDHIVYSGICPLFIEERSSLEETWKSHVDKTGRAPKITAVRGLGIFGAGINEKAAKLELELFKDSCKIAVYSEPFGGPKFMNQEQMDFINSWEAEVFRTKVSVG